MSRCRHGINCPLSLISKRSVQILYHLSTVYGQLFGSLCNAGVRLSTTIYTATNIPIIIIAFVMSLLYHT